MTRLGHPVQNLAAAVLVGGEIHTHCFEECGVYVCVYVRVCVICRLNHCTLSGTMLIRIEMHISTDVHLICYLKWARSALRALWLEGWGSSC